MRKQLSSEQRHERRSEGKQMLIEHFEGGFAAERITNEHCKEINHLILTETTASEAHPLTKRLKHAQTREVVGNDSHLAKPRGENGNRLR